MYTYPCIAFIKGHQRNCSIYQLKHALADIWNNFPHRKRNCFIYQLNQEKKLFHILAKANRETVLYIS